jgi:hypothetical protein
MNALKDLLIQGEVQIKRKNAMDNWRLLARIFRLQIVLYTLEVDEEYIDYDMEKREYFSRVINNRVLKLIVVCITKAWNKQ